MEVIKHGDLYNEKKIECGCGCEFIPQITDVKAFNNDPLDAYVVCPECGSTIKVDHMLRKRD